jgi:hypothetical protein
MADGYEVGPSGGMTQGEIKRMTAWRDDEPAPSVPPEGELREWFHAWVDNSDDQRYIGVPRETLHVAVDKLADWLDASRSRASGVEGDELVDCPRCGRPNKTTREWPGSVCDQCGRELGVPSPAPAGLTPEDAKELLECVRIVPPMARPNPSLLRRLRSLASGSGEQ